MKNGTKTVHELKTDPGCFQAMARGKKTFEIRYDDRGYKAGDRLHLRETQFTGEEMKAGSPLIYTGQEEWLLVRYIMRGPTYGLKEGWVIMS